MKRLLLIGLAILSGLAIIFGGGYYLFSKKPEEDKSKSNSRGLVVYRDPKTSVSVKYPDFASISRISGEDKKANIILRLTEKEGQTPMLVTLRSESGLRIVANLTKVEIIDTLMRNSEKALPQRFKDFRKESSRRFEQDGRKAGEIIFTYEGRVPGEKLKQRLVMVVKDDDTAVYLTMQSKEMDFKDKNSKVFDTIASSLRF